MKVIKALRMEVSNDRTKELGFIYITLRAKLRGLISNKEQDITYGLNLYYNSLENEKAGKEPRYLKNFVLFNEELESVTHCKSSIILEDLGFQLKVGHSSIRILDFSAWSHLESDITSKSNGVALVTVRADKWEFSTVSDRHRKGYSTISPLISLIGLIKEVLNNPNVGDDSVLSYLKNDNEEVEIEDLTYNIFE